MPALKDSPFNEQPRQSIQYIQGVSPSLLIWQ